MSDPFWLINAAERGHRNVGFRGTPENIRSIRALPVMTRAGPQAQQFCWRQRPTVVASSRHEPSRARCAAWRFRMGCYRPAHAQQTMSVIGFLHSGVPGPNANRLTGFRKGLREGGFVEGQNVAIEFRWARVPVG
jgi:hypothetical protein